MPGVPMTSDRCLLPCPKPFPKSYPSLALSGDYGRTPWERVAITLFAPGLSPLHGRFMAFRPVETAPLSMLADIVFPSGSGQRVSGSDRFGS